MPSDAIVDNRLSIIHSLQPAQLTNVRFQASPPNRSHLANQLLIYDRVAIPTIDMAIVPILISWMGLSQFRRELGEGTFAFLHKPRLLGYAGNGNGLSTFEIRPSKERPFEWHQEALFSETAAYSGEIDH